MYPLADRDWAGVPHAMVALLLAATAVGLLLLPGGTGPETRLAVERATPPSAGERPRIAIRREPAGQPFTDAGASFNVLPEPGSEWAATLRREDPGGGRRWLVVAVAVENLARRDFDPGLLSYLLRGAKRTLLAPARSGAVGPTTLATRNGLPVGARAEQRLAFRLPIGLHEPVLAIQPSPARALEVRVPLRGQ